MWSILLLSILICDSQSMNFDRKWQKIVQPKIIEVPIRTRRDLFDNIYVETSDKLKLIEIEDWVLQLNSQANLVVTPNLEWILPNGAVMLKEVRKCDYNSGVVRGLEIKSSVAVSICGDHITGYLNIEDEHYFLEPITDGHLLYSLSNSAKFSTSKRKRDVYAVEDNQWLFNLTGDTIEIGEPSKLFNENDDENFLPDLPRNKTSLTNWRREEEDPEELGYFLDTAWSADRTPIRRKPLNSNLISLRWLEVAIAVDYTVISFHGKDKVEQYILALMNIVNAIYQDVSLEANMKLAITRILLYEHKKQSVVRPGNSRKSLENVNSWNNRLHISLAPGEPRHDIAIWLTRLDIGGPSGYAPVAGVCDPKRSCALNRDEGLTSAFIIAHEMAHILGLSHDGDKNNNNVCGDEAQEGSVMAPMVAATFNKFSWSECSKHEFKHLSKRWTCLSNSPDTAMEISLNSTLQNAFTMDEQCRMEFGEGYSLCRSFDTIEPCSHLWCGHVRSPYVCKTKKGSPLEGTECGFDKWCVNGYCENIGKKNPHTIPVVLNPQDGGWSDWGPWGACSRTCGTGVKFRVRKCNNPEPLYGGNDCQGSSEEWNICILNQCPEPFKDLRAQQCKRLPKLLNILNTREGNMTWLPYENDQFEKKCKLICISKDNKEVFETAEHLIDGTPCSYENSDNICIQGVCQILGCDGKLLSTKKTDTCGVCGGNNTDCSVVESISTKKLKRELSRIAVLPRMARQIKIEANLTMQAIDDPDVAFVLKNRRKKRYTVTVPNTGLHTEILEGTKFYYQKTANRHNIWATGPVLAEMVILVYAPNSEIDQGITVSLYSQYRTNKDYSTASDRYKWILGGWGPCSASCGGGRKQQTVACWDTMNQKLTKRKLCPLISKPTVKMEKCNTFDCNFQWIAGKWEPCSATCGLNGIQHRELYCVPQVVLNTMLFKNNGTVLQELWKYMVSPNKCSGINPISERPCNREPCKSFWTWEEWSQCSASCGSGLMTRAAHCPPINDENFFSCDGEPPRLQTQTCKGAFTRHNNPLCKGRKKKPCKGDLSIYCSLQILSTYCKLGGFRRLCCKSCSTFQLLPVSV